MDQCPSGGVSDDDDDDDDELEPHVVLESIAYLKRFASLDSRLRQPEQIPTSFHRCQKTHSLLFSSNISSWTTILKTIVGPSDKDLRTSTTRHTNFDRITESPSWPASSSVCRFSTLTACARGWIARSRVLGDVAVQRP
ncbi:hypothetical protein MY4824_002746 [Beauveria thailandica]